MPNSSVLVRKGIIDNRVAEAKKLGDLIFEECNIGTVYIYQSLLSIREHYKELIDGLTYELNGNEENVYKKSKESLISEMATS